MPWIVPEPQCRSVLSAMNSASVPEVCPDGEKSRFPRTTQHQFHQSKRPYPRMTVTSSENFIALPLILSITATIEYPSGALPGAAPAAHFKRPYQKCSGQTLLQRSDLACRSISDRVLAFTAPNAALVRKSTLNVIVIAGVHYRQMERTLFDENGKPRIISVGGEYTRERNRL